MKSQRRADEGLGGFIAHKRSPGTLGRLVSPERQISALAKRALPERPEASVTLAAEGTTANSSVSGDIAVKIDERQYDEGHGLCLDAATSVQGVE